MVQRELVSFRHLGQLLQQLNKSRDSGKGRVVLPRALAMLQSYFIKLGFPIAFKNKGHKILKAPSSAHGDHHIGSCTTRVTPACSQGIRHKNQVFMYLWGLNWTWNYSWTHTQEDVLFQPGQELSEVICFGWADWAHLLKTHIKHFPLKHLRHRQQSPSILAGRRPTFMLLFSSYNEIIACSFCNTSESDL